MPLDAAEIAALPRTHGHLDQILLKPEKLEIEGWMLDPKRPFEAVELYVDGDCIGVAQPRKRRDVAEVFPRVAHSAETGFHAAGPDFGRILEAQLVPVEAVAFSDGAAVSIVRGYHLGTARENAPTPPEELIRMIGSPHMDAYRTQGVQIFGDLLHAVSPTTDFAATRRVLDWGSGCGRVAVHFLEWFPHLEFFGCDVVPELVDWCSRHLARGEFSLIDPFPPTPFEDGFFDLAFSSSVMTHLKRDVQLAWLAEIRRILRPGGVFAVSTLGESAYLRDFVYSRHGRSWFGLRRPQRPRRHTLTECGGILDDIPNLSLGRAVPEGYYRNVYQTREYTQRAWSGHFRIVDHVALGLDHYQDLVVMVREN